MHSGQRFMITRTFLKIYQIVPYFVPYWAPKEASPFKITDDRRQTNVDQNSLPEPET